MSRARAVFALALLASGAHCTRELDLLTRDDAQTSTGPGTGAAGGAGTGGDSGSAGGGGDGGSCALLPIGSACSASSECCSGLCALDPEGKISCRPTTGCLGLGKDCDFASACCSLGCSDPDEQGQHQCGDTLTCSVVGDVCISGVDCCSGDCAGGTCQPSAGGCRPAGEACAKSDECCGQSCVEGRCALAQGCRVAGEQCGVGGDCCSGLCRNDPANVPRCQSLIACSAVDGKSCVRQAGEICKDDAECCTRACRSSSDGAKRCAYLGGCHQQCEICTDAGSCCSGACEPDNTGVLRCAPLPSAVCIATGEICGGPATDCCPEGPGGACGEPGPMMPPKRCLGEAGPKNKKKTGEPCALPAECEGTICAPGDGGALVCAAACLPPGGACSARTDCCDVLTHDCMQLGTGPVCVALIH